MTPSSLTVSKHDAALHVGGRGLGISSFPASKLVMWLFCIGVFAPAIAPTSLAVQDSEFLPYISIFGMAAFVSAVLLASILDSLSSTSSTIGLRFDRPFLFAAAIAFYGMGVGIARGNQTELLLSDTANYGFYAVSFLLANYLARQLPNAPSVLLRTVNFACKLKFIYLILLIDVLGMPLLFGETGADLTHRYPREPIFIILGISSFYALAYTRGKGFIWNSFWLLASIYVMAASLSRGLLGGFTMAVIIMLIWSPAHRRLLRGKLIIALGAIAVILAVAKGDLLTQLSDRVLFAREQITTSSVDKEDVKFRRVFEIFQVTHATVTNPQILWLGNGFGGTYYGVTGISRKSLVVGDRHFIHMLYIGLWNKLGSIVTLILLIVTTAFFWRWFRYLRKPSTLAKSGSPRHELVWVSFCSWIALMAVSVVNPFLLIFPFSVIWGSLLKMSHLESRGNGSTQTTRQIELQPLPGKPSIQ